MRKRYRVTGWSMAPELKPGEEVLIDAASHHQLEIKEGDLVVVMHPLEPGLRILKRVQTVDNDGILFVVGDNEDESTDSRHFGAISPGNLVGKVVCRF